MTSAFLDDFRQTLDDARARLLRLSEADAARPPAPGKWSAKEIIGHLIDSAANNHARFVGAQTVDHLAFEGYDQAAWVQVQQYRNRPWQELVDLWHAYNRHLLAVMTSADRQALTKPRPRHTLDRIAFRPLPAGSPATLAYLMEDYVAHLKHHLQQISQLRK
jgi:hypothetical protein